MCNCGKETVLVCQFLVCAFCAFAQEIPAMNDRFSLPKADPLDFDNPDFSNLGPLVAALGTLVGIVLFILLIGHF
jgi:hypothetical protein